MNIMLNTKEAKVRAALRHPALAGLKRIGRGAFCVVYDKGETVLKATSDPVQYGFYTDYTAPNGPHFPKLIHNYGEIGETAAGDSIYLVEMEKLSKIPRSGPLRQEAKRLLTIMHGAAVMTAGCGDEKRDSHEALLMAADDDRLTVDLRAALLDVADFISNYDAMQDFGMKNLMLRDQTIILNDVVADVRSVQKLWDRRGYT